MEKLPEDTDTSFLCKVHFCARIYNPNTVEAIPFPSLIWKPACHYGFATPSWSFWVITTVIKDMNPMMMIRSGRSMA